LKDVPPWISVPLCGTDLTARPLTRTKQLWFFVKEGPLARTKQLYFFNY
jgi:hypothetical protein